MPTTTGDNNHTMTLVPTFRLLGASLRSIFAAIDKKKHSDQGDCLALYSRVVLPAAVRLTRFAEQARLVLVSHSPILDLKAVLQRNTRMESLFERI